MGTSMDTSVDGKVSSPRVGVTTDRDDPRLGWEIQEGEEKVPQNGAYLVLSEEERAKGFVRPYRDTYVHLSCGTRTTMGRAISETYARDPRFYSSTYCVSCRQHRPLNGFRWIEPDGSVGGQVGS